MHSQAWFPLNGDCAFEIKMLMDSRGSSVISHTVKTLNCFKVEIGSKIRIFLRHKRAASELMPRNGYALKVAN